MHDNELSAEAPDLAYFSERALAFGIDLTLALLGYFLSMKVAWPYYGLLTNPNSYSWSVLWVAVFLVYQAVANAEGRCSWGKALVGIRVCDLEGRPLTLGQSFLRSVGYIASSSFYLGFLWALFNHRLQTWHDRLAGTIVVQSEPRAGRPGVVAAAWGVAGTVLVHWVWVFVLSTPYYRTQTVANAKIGLESVARAEKEYFRAHGRYTDNLYVLANHTGAPEAFIASLGMTFDFARGFELKPEGRRLQITAVARDDLRTPVQIAVD